MIGHTCPNGSFELCIRNGFKYCHSYFQFDLSAIGHLTTQLSQADILSHVLTLGTGCTGFPEAAGVKVERDTVRIFAMPHCTHNFAWYLGKFVLGFAGILFLYLGFINEKDVTCVCKARAREAARRDGVREPHRCLCRKGFRKPKAYACGCVRRLLSKTDVRCSEKIRSEPAAEGGCCCTSRRN